MRATLEVFSLATGQRRVVLQTDRLIEAPNWSPDGQWLMVNADGRLWRVPLDRPALLPIDTGAADLCNNDHGFLPDGRIILSSHHGGQGAEIYLLDGGLHRLSPQAPSWWHGLSPDGLTMVYAAARGSRVIDIYRRALSGGPEQRLTFGEGQSDGPEFSASGGQVFYNCDRGGHAQIWVMEADGRSHEPLFSDERVNWFPHPSPDGRHLVYLSYPPGTQGHPRDLPVRIMLCDPEGQHRREVAAITGGQGTMNVPNWSPDSGAFAFVSYQAGGG